MTVTPARCDGREDGCVLHYGHAGLCCHSPTAAGEKGCDVELLPEPSQVSDLPPNRALALDLGLVLDLVEERLLADLPARTRSRCTDAVMSLRSLRVALLVGTMRVRVPE